MAYSGNNNDNPYLPNQRGGPSKTSVSDPLEGLVPRFVTAAQARAVLVSQDLQFRRQRIMLTSRYVKDGGINPFTKLPYSSQFKKILESRKKLPVYAQMNEFYEIVGLY
jgi:pre-mRNA-splicing factor ATP-dependent RNA helicase DHX15/PRP43